MQNRDPSSLLIIFPGSPHKTYTLDQSKLATPFLKPRGLEKVSMHRLSKLWGAGVMLSAEVSSLRTSESQAIQN